MIRPSDIAWSERNEDAFGTKKIIGEFRIVGSCTLSERHATNDRAIRETKRHIVSRMVSEMYPTSLKNHIEELYSLALMNGYSYHERAGQLKHEIDRELSYQEIND